MASTSAIEKAPPRNLAFGLTSIVAVFTSAALLFVVEPMAARILLPAFGGSPAVWNTALAFYQLALLAGYLYSHWVSIWVPVAVRPWLHAAVVLAPIACLPPWPVPAAGLAVGASNSWAVVLSLATSVGLPFFALSTNASLVQRWLASQEHGARNPYRLYAVSNAGSLVALLAYPFLLEPRLGLHQQAAAWSVGYLLFAALAIALMRWPSHVAADQASSPEPRARPLGVGRRLGWLIRSAVPCVVLMAATLVITADVLSMPLWWVLPLALYLLGYIIAFAWPERLPRSAIALLTTLCVGLALTAAGLHLVLPTVGLLGLALLTVLTSSLLCHGDLARDRPPPEQLTEFYLWVAAGGAFGGILTSLVAPTVFKSVAEWPIGLVLLAALVFPSAQTDVGKSGRNSPRWADGLPWLTTILVGLTSLAGLATDWRASRAWWLVLLVALLPYALAFRQRRWLFPLAAGFIAAAVILGWHSPQPVVEQDRSFFGVVRVREAEDRRFLVHGTTVHGTQFLSAELRQVPGSYFHPRGPLGSVVAAQPADARIGLIGLGTGALAVLGKPSQVIDIFEIDPLVERMARRWFTYLADSPARVNVHIVDGRLGLAAQPAGHYHLVVGDAFSSDSVPAHLLTAEALELALSRTRPDGLVVYHISNRSLDLVRIFRGWSKATGRPVAFAYWRPSSSERAEGASTTVAVAFAPQAETVWALVQESGGLWQPLALDGPAVLWTDERSSLLGVLHRLW